MRTRRALLIALCLLLPLAFASPARGADEARITLLFTSDIHSSAVPHRVRIDGNAVLAGGYARLKTAVDANAEPGRTLLLDSGDFSMTAIYQAFTESDALELTTMDEIGYDAIALGNHDLDIGEDGLARELDRFYENGGTAKLLCANLRAPDGGVHPLAEHGVADMAVFERGGVRIGVFALMGKEAAKYTAATFADTVETANACAKRLREEEGAELVVLLSHGGVRPDGSFDEDMRLAEATDGIDVLLSGHMHIPFPAQTASNGTVVACAGSTLTHLGRLDLTRENGAWRAECRLIPLTDEWTPDAAVAARIDGYTERLNREYLSKCGVTRGLEDVFAYSPRDLESGDDMLPRRDNYAMGALVCDACLDAARELGHSDAQIALVPVGVVRAGLLEGPLTVMDVYNVLSYGISPLDGSGGAPLGTMWLTGRELYDVCETSVSVGELLGSAQILMSGLRYTYSMARPILNRVYAVEARSAQTGAFEPVARDDSRLYEVIGSWTAIQNIALIKSSSYDLLSVEPKDENGVVLTEDGLKARLLRLEDGGELKEWYALYRYIESMDKNADGLHQIDARYAAPADFMREGEASLVTFFQNPSKAAWIMLGAAGALALALTLSAVGISRRVAKRRRGKAA